MRLSMVCKPSNGDYPYTSDALQPRNPVESGFRGYCIIIYFDKKEKTYFCDYPEFQNSRIATYWAYWYNNEYYSLFRKRRMRISL